MKRTPICNHHNKLNSTTPTWLYFALYDYQGKFKTDNPLEITANILKSLKRHREERKKLGLDIELVPNVYDAFQFCKKCFPYEKSKESREYY